MADSLRDPLSPTLVRGARPASAQTAGRDKIKEFPLSHRTATANGVRLHYVIAGAGEPLVLLHGNPETWLAWRKTLPALCAQYTVIAPDLRGLGDSERPAGGYDKRTMAEDIWELMRSLGHNRFLVAGHDFGGSVAYALAATHPDAVRRLAVMECLPAGLLRDGAVLQALGERLKGRAWFGEFNRVPDLPETLLAGREGAYLNYLFAQYSANPGVPSAQEKREYVKAYSRPGAMRASLALYRAEPVDRADNGKLMQTKLPMPVLAIGGSECFADATGAALRAAATNVQSVTLPGCGHFVPEEKPEELIALLLPFFAGGANG